MLAIGDRKVCSACRTELPLSGFDKNRAQKDGLANQCKICLARSRKNTIKKDHARHREIQMRSYRMRKYGVAPAEYDAMVEAAAGRCPVCESLPKAPWKCLEVDHDHATGKVRGVLCHSCSRALGMAQDNAKVLRSLADYVEAHTGAADR